MPDTELAASGSEPVSLSIDEAVKAYTATQEPEPQGQPEPEAEQEGETTDDELQATDEAAGEEDDGATEDAGQADDEADAEPESDQGRFVASNGKVKLPDGTVSTVADLIQGNLRDRDYRQKTMETAELRKQAEAQSSAIKQREQELSQQAEYATRLIQAILPPPPDPELANPQSPKFDLVTYMSQEAARKQWAEHLSYLDQQQQQTAEQAKSETEKQAKERREAEWAKALEKLPELKDPKRLEAFGMEVNKYGQTYGYTPQELSAVANDHRSLVVLKKAIAWDKLQASKTTVQQKVENRPPVQRGGKRLNPAEARTRAATDATNRLQQTGRLDDAVAAYLALQK